MDRSPRTAPGVHRDLAVWDDPTLHGRDMTGEEVKEIQAGLHAAERN